MVLCTSPNQLTVASGGKQSSDCDPDDNNNGRHEDERQFSSPFRADFGSGGEYARASGNANHHDNDDQHFDGDFAGRNDHHGRAGQSDRERRGRRA